MKKIDQLYKICEYYTLCFKKDFKKIENWEGNEIEAVRYTEIFFLDEWKYADSRPFYMPYRLSFLSHLTRLERDTIAFAYSVQKYIDTMKAFDTFYKDREYLNFLEVELEENFFEDDEEIIMPHFRYHLWRNHENKLQTLEWADWVKLWKKSKKRENYIKKIISSLGMETFFNVISYREIHDTDDSITCIDFCFNTFKNKKMVWDYLNLKVE